MLGDLVLEVNELLLPDHVLDKWPEAPSHQVNELVGVTDAHFVEAVSLGPRQDRLMGGVRNEKGPEHRARAGGCVVDDNETAT